MMRWWRRIATAVDVFALLAAALVAALAAGHGHVSGANAWLAAIDVSFVLVVMLTRARRVSRMQSSALDGCVEALKVCSLGALLALATAAILGAERPVPVGPELWLLTAVAVCASRLALQLAQRRARRRGALMTPTLVVGAGGVDGHDVMRRLSSSPSTGFIRSASSTQTRRPAPSTQTWASRFSAARTTSLTCALTPALAT